MVRGGVCDEEQYFTSNETPLEEEGACRETRGGYISKRNDDAFDEVRGTRVMRVVVAVVRQERWHCLVSCGA